MAELKFSGSNEIVNSVCLWDYLFTFGGGVHIIVYMERSEYILLEWFYHVGCGD